MKTFGEIGVLKSEFGKLQCHICGKWYIMLGKHANTHGLTADEYREEFGLNRTTPLIGEQYQKRKSDLLKSRDYWKRNLSRGCDSHASQWDWRKQSKIEHPFQSVETKVKKSISGKEAWKSGRQCKEKMATSMKNRMQNPEFYNKVMGAHQKLRVLTDEQARELVKLYMTGNYTHAELGKIFNIGHGTATNYIHKFRNEVVTCARE